MVSHHFCANPIFINLETTKFQDPVLPYLAHISADLWQKAEHPPIFRLQGQEQL